MNCHPVFNVVAAQVFRVLQDLPGKDKAEIFNWSIVKLERYRLFELKRKDLLTICLQHLEMLGYLPHCHIFLNLHRLLLLRGLHLNCDLGGL